MAVIKTRFKEATLRIQKYQEYIEALSKMGSDKYAWGPTPKILINKVKELHFVKKKNKNSEKRNKD